MKFAPGTSQSQMAAATAAANKPKFKAEPAVARRPAFGRDSGARKNAAEQAANVKSKTDQRALNAAAAATRPAGRTGRPGFMSDKLRGSAPAAAAATGRPGFMSDKLRGSAPAAAAATSPAGNIQPDYGAKAGGVVPSAMSMRKTPPKPIASSGTKSEAARCGTGSGMSKPKTGFGSAMSGPKTGLGTAMGMNKMAGAGAAMGKKLGMKSGGSVGSVSKRADGIATKGKTKGRMC